MLAQDPSRGDLLEQGLSPRSPSPEEAPCPATSAPWGGGWAVCPGGIWLLHGAGTGGAAVRLFVSYGGCRLESHSPKSPHPQARATSWVWALVPVPSSADGPSVSGEVLGGAGSTHRPAASPWPYLGEVPDEFPVVIGQQVLNLLMAERPGAQQPRFLQRQLPQC